MARKPFGIRETWLRCIGCGAKADLLKERKFRCGKCGNLFDVRHDLRRLQISPGMLKRMFKKRSGGFSVSSPPWSRSGVWRYYELIMPYLPYDKIITLGEGNVPIIPAGPNLRKWIGGEEIDLWLILEGMTPTGSFKDFGGTVLISIAKAAGVEAIVCASTGDTSAMAAAYAAAAGIKCAVILPAGKVTPVQAAQPLVHGAKVIFLPTDFDGCMKVVEGLVKNYGAYPANSLNPARIEGHQATAFQIAQFFNWQMPNWISLPVGNGSNCSSVGKGMRLMKELGLVAGLSRILGCQSSAANPLARSWAKISPCPLEIFGDRWRDTYRPVEVGETTATAARIGNPVSAAKVMREILFSQGVMATAEEPDLNQAVAECGKDGIFVCPQTGTALAGVRNAVKTGYIKPGDKVVVVSTATGLKFTESTAVHLQKQIIRSSDCSVSAVAKILGL